MPDNYVVCGMAFGDEGKGSFIDYLALSYGIKNIVRYNGGSQAGHTVITPGGVLHKFSQLSSGTFYSQSRTFLSSNMVINPINIVEEAHRFALKSGLDLEEILARVFIHEDCWIVTPYHKLLNKLRELSSKDNKRGSVGTGVSEVMILLEENLGVKFKDLYASDILKKKLTDLCQYTADFISRNSEVIKEVINQPEYESLRQEYDYLTNFSSIGNIHNYYLLLIKSNKFNICNDFFKYLGAGEPAIYEGSQGLLLDRVYGFKPNTTMLDTTNKYALKMLFDYQNDNVVKIGVLKAFSTRHGIGIFPTEDNNLNTKISDENQSNGFSNGSMRFGWFDAVLVRYAQKINQVDELYLSSLDKLNFFSKIKICNSYKYFGKVDDKFRSLFDFYESDGEIIIKDIKCHDDILTLYLKQCQPVYTVVDGWNKDISDCHEKSDLPSACIGYIEEIEKLINIKVTVISVGPTRINKIRTL